MQLLLKIFLLSGLLLCMGKLVAGQSSMDSSCLESIREHAKELVVPKGKGAVAFSGDTIHFDRSLVILHHSAEEARLIFKKGLLYPEAIVAARTDGSGTVKVSTIGFIGKLVLSSFVPLNISSTSIHRVYSFLLWHEGYANPSLYLLQLTNDDARAGTSAADFINGARVTAFGFCSILI